MLLPMTLTPLYSARLGNFFGFHGDVLKRQTLGPLSPSESAETKEIVVAVNLRVVTVLRVSGRDLLFVYVCWRWWLAGVCQNPSVMDDSRG